MVTVRFAYHSYRPEYNPAAGRWDQLALDRILRGDEHRPPAGFSFVESTHAEVIANGGVLILPVGSYHDHGDEHRVLFDLWQDLKSMPWGVVFATSDECDHFPFNKIDPWPEHIQLYVQLPRPEHTYPPGTRFFGEGSPVSASEIQAGAALTRDLDLMLVGQAGHERRERCFEAVDWAAFGLQVRSDYPHQTMVERTDGFTLGLTQEEYLFHLTRTWVAPAPSGVCSQSSFRAFEALEAGAIPVADGLRPGDIGAGYWEMIGLGDWLAVIDDWAMIGGVVDDLLADRCRRAAKVTAGWQRYKRRFVEVIHDDIGRMGNLGRSFDEPEDQITVVVVTSPVPSNPDLDMIQEVIASTRTDLPGAEILIFCDGVRKDAQHRRPAYDEFCRRLTQWCLSQWNVTPFVHDDHLHQSGLMWKALNEVRTPYLLFVEHDCPIVGCVPWADIIATMQLRDVNSMRLMHEASILPGHEHLFLDRHPDDPAPWTETIQWSQRPHLASTNWYRQIMADVFAPSARTFIEDVAYGIVQHGVVFDPDGGAESRNATRIQAVEAWKRHRLGIYAPDGNMKRSGHLDGRAGDPKGKLLIRYPNQRPDGAPPEGLTRV
jgi:hypothetical protein